MKEVTIDYKNTRATTWVAGEVFLRQMSPSTNWFEGNVGSSTASIQNHIKLPASVPPGSVATFKFRVEAPAATGSYDLGWQLYDRAGPVLDTAASRTILVVTLADVTPPGTPPPIDAHPLPLHPPPFPPPAQVANGQGNSLLNDAPGFDDPHPNAGKVIRRKIADITPTEGGSMPGKNW